mmetsp:Transcript_5328/g.8805  ORF Transcript_5328/g.8805 Transcript_5328/m.8805 type:complete len:458 (-) Transcript_5328:90-1463(-)
MMVRQVDELYLPTSASVRQRFRFAAAAAGDAESVDHERQDRDREAMMLGNKIRAPTSPSPQRRQAASEKLRLCCLSTLLLTLLYVAIDRLSLSTSDVVVASVKTSSTQYAYEVYPKRITQLDPSDNFSFVHISKCAGSTWIRLFNSILKLSICPEQENGPELSVFYQRNKHCKDADYTLISLRSPRHHVWSQFTMCKYSAWGVNITRDYKDFPRSGAESEDDEADFDTWLDHFVSMGDETNNHYNCYHPANFQTRVLTSSNHWVKSGIGGFNANMTLAKKTYEDLDFVALVEFVHESQCMLYYRLGNKAPPVALSYLSQSCDCEKQQGYLQKSSSRNGTVHVQHHNMGKRTNLRDLPPASLSKVANFISADSVIYLNALKHFMDEMAWLESDNALGRRVVCDDVLKKWEPELSYLDGGRFNVSQLYRNAVLKNEAVDPFLPSPSEAQQQWKSGRQRD